MGRVRSDVNSGLAPSPCGPATWPPRTKPSATHHTAECRRWKGPDSSHWAQRSRFTAGKTKAEGAPSPTAALDRAVHPWMGLCLCPFQKPPLGTLRPVVVSARLPSCVQLCGARGGL